MAGRRGRATRAVQLRHHPRRGDRRRPVRLAHPHRVRRRRRPDPRRGVSYDASVCRRSHPRSLRCSERGLLIHRRTQRPRLLVAERMARDRVWRASRRAPGATGGAAGWLRATRRAMPGARPTGGGVPRRSPPRPWRAARAFPLNSNWTSGAMYGRPSGVPSAESGQGRDTRGSRRKTHRRPAGSVSASISCSPHGAPGAGRPQTLWIGAGRVSPGPTAAAPPAGRRPGGPTPAHADGPARRVGHGGAPARQCRGGSGSESRGRRRWPTRRRATMGTPPRGRGWRPPRVRAVPMAQLRHRGWVEWRRRAHGGTYGTAERRGTA